MKRTALEGGCFVAEPDTVEFSVHGNWAEAAIIDSGSGAQALSQYLVRVSCGDTPIRRFPGSDVVLFVLNGSGSVLICGRKFEIEKDHGVYVAKGESFAIRNPNDDDMLLLVGVCPQCRQRVWLESMPDDFVADFPHRVVAYDQSKSQETGDRFFQLLVGPAHGSHEVTQFIGAIPQSRAKDHYHLYEEAITILSGEGYMWAGETRAPVKPGSMIFLPREQPHCLECTSEDGMKLVGLFYPAGSPAVNY